MKAPPSHEETARLKAKAEEKEKEAVIKAAVDKILTALGDLNKEQQTRILRTAVVFYGMEDSFRARYD